MQHEMRETKNRPMDVMATADDLAHALVDDGMGPHEETLLWMAKMAAREGVTPTLLAAMLDQTAPEVARQRAFGSVMRAMQTRRGPAESLAVSSGAESGRAMATIEAA
jgi:hypothetical protein